MALSPGRVLNGPLDSGVRGPHLSAGLSASSRGPGGDGVLDLPAELMGGIMEDTFGSAAGAAAHTTTDVPTAAAAVVLDPVMLLDEGDNTDIAAVFQEMYHSGGTGGGEVGGGGMALMAHGLLSVQPMDTTGVLAGAAEVARMGVQDDDFLNFLLKS
jgi:hypothetical protein